MTMLSAFTGKNGTTLTMDGTTRDTVDKEDGGGTHVDKNAILMAAKFALENCPERWGVREENDRVVSDLIFVFRKPLNVNKILKVGFELAKVGVHFQLIRPNTFTEHSRDHKVMVLDVDANAGPKLQSQNRKLHFHRGVLEEL